MTDLFDEEWNFDTNAWNPFPLSLLFQILHIYSEESALKRFCPLAHQHLRLKTLFWSVMF